MEVTLQDIADELDLSPATVSRSLRHDKMIRPETRARVNEVARRMGYKQRVGRPRRVVESDSKSTLGLLIRASNLNTAKNDLNMMKMMTGVMAGADELGLILQIHTLRSHRFRTEQESTLIQNLVQDKACQSLILHGEHEESEVEFLAKRLPLVSMGRFYRGLPMDAVVADNSEGVREMVSHLVALGHRQLAWVGAYYNSTFMEARQAGYIQGCLGHQLNLDPRWLLGQESYVDRQLQLEPLLAAVNAGVTGFVCGNDYIALNVIELLNANGIEVPNKVSVTGFDASNNSQIKPLQLTSIDPGFFEIGKAATRLAVQRISDPMTRASILNISSEIVVGDTTAPPHTN
jgi:DNA-binding LacI/PurR family transcriptional regulator